ncbi:MAG: hypothetical protein U9Q77_08585 [Candidatus Marinimicrobia bacterium]|nr:hypothetical protein [Candidatus Neomarinimicrobiota bacterium]
MTAIYLEIIELLFIVGGFMALFMGLLLFFKPEILEGLNKSGNKWYSARKSTKSLDIVRDTNSFYFNNNQLIGTVMLVVSIVALYLVYSRIPTSDEYMVIQGNTASAMGIGILLESLRWVLVVTIMLGIPVWGLLVFNPEKLQSVNTYLDKWISTRLLLLPLEQMNNRFDGYVVRNNRVFGAFFVLGACFILFNFLW